MGFRELWLLWLPLLYQPVECPPLSFPCTPPEKNARHVNFDNCDGSKIGEYIEFSKNAESFSCKACDLTDIPANSFEKHEKTKEVDFSGNIHLNIPLTKCFLKSKYIELLILSDITNIPVLPPNVFECMPNLRELITSGKNCMKTKFSLETVSSNLRVNCEASDNGREYPVGSSSKTDVISTTPLSVVTQKSLKTDMPSSTPKSNEPTSQPEESKLWDLLWAIPVIVVIAAVFLFRRYRVNRNLHDESCVTESFIDSKNSI